MVKAKKNPVGRPAGWGASLEKRTQLRHSDEEKEKWQHAATNAELTLSSWIRIMLNAAAEPDIDVESD